MTLAELVRLFAEDLPLPCALLEAGGDPQSPQLLYANPAYRARVASPGGGLALLGGESADTALLHRLRIAMRDGQPIRLVKGTEPRQGDATMAEIALRPLHGPDGAVTHHLVFEREVRRRRGRPAQGNQRFEPVQEWPDALEKLFTAGLD